MRVLGVVGVVVVVMMTAATAMVVLLIVTINSKETESRSTLSSIVTTEKSKVMQPLALKRGATRSYRDTTTQQP